MIRTCVVTKDNKTLYDIALEDILAMEPKWYWADFCHADESEVKLLSHYFHFHPLAIEDCLDSFNQRPKLDFYDNYQFIVLHELNAENLIPAEVDLFIGDDFLVTFHNEKIPQFDLLWERTKSDENIQKGPFFLMHAIIDKLVDDFFPPVYKLEEELNALEDNADNESISELMERVFDVRADLSSIRRTILPMRDLLYRIIHSDRLNYLKEQQLYFHDVYDHLLKLVEMLELYRDFSADIRDSYLSMNSNTMNSIMMTLTVITTIFMPLTFIVGVYGMNFEYMPMLEWQHGYYAILGFMAVIAALMLLFFLKKGWLHAGRKAKRRRRLKSNRRL
ncbi:magnesium and cobalt transport protein CorA [Peribacillus saganii]|uniref:Magnesium transport protein CorA n=1 Tax=Peribacillus saganii TaxID=2303992 RepID=A0A372LT54_9BACI|nr:magnesium/cobalt transporter CorA [Peribacillus saganii]RFU71077.1 magnesium and cobalt transport protein CorA [Peribacillus saganii]